MEFSVNKPIFKQIVDWCLGRIVAGEAPEAVAETVRLLAEEAKVL